MRRRARVETSTRSPRRDGVVRRLSLRAKAEIALIVFAIVLLSIGNGELAASRSQLEVERRLAAESSAQVERVIDEIQAAIIALLSPAETPAPSDEPLP